jgi:hypothetical protein
MRRAVLGEPAAANRGGRGRSCSDLPLTHPARPVGAAAPSRRGPQSPRGTLQPAMPSVEKETNVDVVVAYFARAGVSHLGPRWVRMAAGTAGPQRARSVHGRQVGIAGHSTFAAPTSAAEAAWRRVQVSHPAAASPPGSCQRCSGHRDGPHPPAELEPSPPGASIVILAGRAISSSHQRYPANSHGHSERVGGRDIRA